MIENLGTNSLGTYYTGSTLCCHGEHILYTIRHEIDPSVPPLPPQYTNSILRVFRQRSNTCNLQSVSDTSENLSVVGLLLRPMNVLSIHQLMGTSMIRPVRYVPVLFVPVRYDPIWYISTSVRLRTPPP